MLNTSLFQSGLIKSQARSLNPSLKLTKPRSEVQQRDSLNRSNRSSVKQRRPAPCAATGDSPMSIERPGQIEENGAKSQILDYKVAVFSAQPYVRDFLDAPMSQNFAKCTFLDARLGKTLSLLSPSSLFPPSLPPSLTLHSFSLQTRLLPI